MRGHFDGDGTRAGANLHAAPADEKSPPPHHQLKAVKLSQIFITITNTNFPNHVTNTAISVVILKTRVKGTVV
jgi:hypothetical protein